MVVNIGGVSNITYIDGPDTLIACDTGPGNALLDDYMYRIMNQPFDCEGRFAAQGGRRGLDRARAANCHSLRCRRQNHSTATILPR